MSRKLSRGLCSAAALTALATATAIARPASATTPAGTAAPVVSSIAPAVGSSVGGQPVLLRGTNLTGVQSVLFGARAATDVHALSARRLAVVAPRGAAGHTVAVVVNTDHGTSAPVSFSYVAPPDTTASAVDFEAIPTGVDCPARGWCAALENGTSFRTLDQGVWTPVASSFDGTLVDLSCGSSRHCVAVGTDTTDGAQNAVAVLLNGTTTSTDVLLEGEPGVAAVYLNHVSCSVTDCVVSGGGSVAGSPGPLVLLSALDRSGQWHSQSLADDVEGISQVSCAAEVCALIAEPTDGGTALYLRDGDTWNRVDVPAAPGGAEPALSDVSCYHGDECAAIGTYSSNGVRNSVVESYANGTWTARAVPRPPLAGSGDVALGRISCGTGTTCVAIGGTYASVITTTSIRTQSVPLPDASATLDLVSCGAGASCAIGGSVPDAQSPGAQWLDLLDGSVWSPRAVRLPAHVAQAPSHMVDLSCAGVDFCVVQGQTSGSLPREVLTTISPTPTAFAVQRAHPGF